MRRTIENSFGEYKTILISLIPMIIGFVIIAVRSKFSLMLDQIWQKERVDAFSVGLAFLVWSLSFVIMAIRREAAMIFLVKGKVAMIYGIIFFFLCQIMGILLIVKALFYNFPITLVLRNVVD